MDPEGGRSLSLWADTAEVPGRPSLAEDAKADVCIVGAGIAGLTTAYLLAREGRSVVVLDDGPVGGGETGRTTAHLASALDDRFVHLERLHGEKGARLAAESHAAAIDRIEAIAGRERIACEFERVDGYLFDPPGGTGGDVLEKELQAARRAGLDVQRVGRAPLGAYDTGPALRFAAQAQFHPLKYLAGLAGAVLQAGGRIFTGVHVEAFEGGRHAHVTTTSGRTVSAQALVVATNTPVNDRLVIHTKQAAYRTYAVGLAVPEGTLRRALFWDTLDPYHYVRVQAATGAVPEIVIVGGEDHRTGQEEDAAARWGRLEAWARERFPTAREVRYRWSGQVLEPADALAFIGRNPMDKDNVFIATGDSGHGLTHGTIAGVLLTDLIQGRDNPWAELYDPARKTPRAARDFVSELAQSAKPYGQWVAPAEVASPAEVAPGEGAVMREGVRPVAVHRETGGGLVKVSAVCPHLGCIVEWNTGEKTWDCPCHGSRFAPDGRVLNGPARTDLNRAD